MYFYKFYDYGLINLRNVFYDIYLCICVICIAAHVFIKRLLYRPQFLYCLPISFYVLALKKLLGGLLGPVAYNSYCVSLKNYFPLKLYVFLKNIVLHNIIGETN